MIEKMEKHALLSEKLIQEHTLALEQHGPLKLTVILIVDVESGNFMDETNHIFNLCKRRYTEEIEKKSKVKKIEVLSALEPRVMVGCDEETYFCYFEGCSVG